MRTKRGKAGILATGIMALVVGIAEPGCVIRHGSEEFGFFAIPLLPMVWAHHKTYQSNTSREVMNAERFFMTAFFGSGAIEIKSYGKDEKYLGKHKIDFNNHFGNINFRTRSYDVNDELVSDIKGLPSDMGYNSGTGRFLPR